MALAFDGWKMIPRQALSAATVAGLLADITSLMNGTDGWTVETDADGFGISLTPPHADLADDLRIHFAGKNASIGTPTMLLINGVTALDTAIIDILLVGMSGGNAGGYGTLNWDAALPHGAGSWFSGYCRGIPVTNTGYITIFYTSTAIMIATDNNTGATVKYIIAGAWVDPKSTDPNDAEANGYVYGMSMSGGVATTGLVSGIWDNSLVPNSATANRFLVHGTADGNAHSVYRNPADGLWRQFTRTSGPVPFPSTLLSFKSAGGRDYLHPIALGTPDGSSAGSRLIGYAKNMWIVDTFQRYLSTTIAEGGVDAGYIFSASPVAAAAGALMQAKETFS